MSFLLCKLFDGFMEFLVFNFCFLFFKFLDFVLLLQKPAFHFGHVGIWLEHFCEEIIWSTYGYFGLNQNFHSWHYIFTSIIVKCNLPLYVVIYLQGFCTFWQTDFCRISYCHMLCKWNFSLLFNKFLGFQAIVEILFDFMQPFTNPLNIIDAPLSKFEKFILFVFLWRHVRN